MENYTSFDELKKECEKHGFVFSNNKGYSHYGTVDVNGFSAPFELLSTEFPRVISLVVDDERVIRKFPLSPSIVYTQMYTEGKKIIAEYHFGNVDERVNGMINLSKLGRFDILEINGMSYQEYCQERCQKYPTHEEKRQTFAETNTPYKTRYR